MIKSANQYPTSAIFGIEDKIKYVIPKFQREYVWRKIDWDNLLNDLSENDKGHFLGSIIVVDKGTDVLEVKPIEVIDGQQRLTTISLLYVAIYDKFLSETRDDEEFVTEKINLKNRLIQKGSKNVLKLELSYQNNNYDDYKAILHGMHLYSETHFKKPSNLGNRRIYKIFQYFKEKISKYSYTDLIKLLEKINSSLFVKIEVSSHADAFILFESLNNRGIPLSAMDLIKNKLLAELEKKKLLSAELEKGKLLSIEEAFDKWLILTDSLPDYSIQERFLRQYYNAYRYKKEVKLEGVSKAIRSTLIKIYERLIDKDVNFIFEELINKAIIYNNFITPKDELVGLQSLSQIGAAPSYTFLLYLLSEHQGKTKLLIATIDFLIKYFVRRNLTDFPATRDLDNIFMALIDECEKMKETLSLEMITKYMVNSDRFSALDKFKEKLEGDIYEDNADVARFILCKIEEEHQTKEIYKDLWEKDKNGKYLWTIEHIFPEGKSIPDAWVEMIASGDKKKAKEIQERWVHKLGNLTITAYNPNLSNFDFEKKRDRQDNKGKYIGYKNGLFLNSELIKKDKWQIKDIERRTQELTDIALKLFALDRELKYHPAI
jgi:uncharacterized protein with ParB-like and HNH nuclease domain